MRLYDGPNRGIPLDAHDHLLVGEQKVKFHSSLYTTCGATFGNRLMFAELIRGLDDVYQLHGCSIEKSECGDLGALVRIKLGHGTQVCQPLSGQPQLILGHTLQRSRVYSGETFHVYQWTEFHALAVLPRGSSMKLTHSLKATNHQSLLDRLLGRKQPCTQVEVVTTLSFDGENIQVATERHEQEIGNLSN